MIAQIQMRRGTTAEWAAADPVVLAEGEQGYDTTLKRFKIGDGATAFSALEWNTLLPYPVGAIYMSVSSTSPATLFGGTWAALGGRMLVGVDGTYTAGSTGGAATHAHAVTGAARLYPVSTYGFVKMVNTYSYTSTHRFQYAANVVADETAYPDIGVEVVGAAAAGSSLPPYIAVYMWKRTA